MSSVICIGGSSGSIEVVKEILAGLPRDFKTPVVAVIHRHVESCDVLLRMLHVGGNPAIVEPFDKHSLLQGGIFLAPSDYHLLVDEQHICLSTDPPDFHARPGIDPLFNSAALAFGSGTTAILLSGSNRDGAAGAARIRAHGGKVIAQDPRSAMAPEMPQSALDYVEDAIVARPDEIVRILTDGIT